MNSYIKNLIPKITSTKIYKNYQLLREAFLDIDKYRKYSATISQNKNRSMSESELIFYYHKIEKGLSLPKTRLKFGYEAVEHLTVILENYVGKYGWEKVAIVALNTLKAYVKYNENNGVELNHLGNRILKLESSLRLNNMQGGIVEIKKEDIEKNRIDFKSFAYSRYSIRNFADQEVDLSIIEEAVLIAQKSPSVCNRQSSRVYVYSDKEIQNEILKHQNGNRGFGHLADKIIIVTSKLDHFIGHGERNQSYIDGGMYSMSLIYALHSLGIGTCPLNLALTNNAEKKLKEVARIDNSEVLMMMIAVGHLPTNLNVAASIRREVSEVLKII
ncbi:nitroreductase family protein [Planococcus halocryophilus]|uniref:nitroreductase family protein n=1 Tax=Planococcus halocryophilus TaxID=1215089 RepID=UPI001F0D86C6|nr:nitroreductase family protein [Planococcus halocryophilus]MCH4826783.1 nitroreductase family protein [Planococcus halocryophilus]